MKLQARLTIPLFVIGAAATAVSVLGIIFLIRFTFGNILRSQGANIGNIALTVLESRTDQLNQVANQLAAMPGNFRGKAGAIKSASQLDFAMEISGKNAALAYGALPSEACLAGLSDSGKHQPILISSGNSVLIAGMSRDNKSGITTVVGQVIDRKFVSALKELLRMDIRITSGAISVASLESFTRPESDFVETSLRVEGPCGEADITMLVPSQGAIRSFNRTLAWSAGLLGFVLISTWLVYFLLVREVTRPILALNRAVEEVASGNLPARIPEGGPDELGILVQRFNEMSTSLKAAQEKVVHSAKLASVGEMVAGISHELNNPLSGIIGQAEYLSTKLPPGEPGGEELGIILTEARRMKQTLAQLRGLIKPADAEKTAVDINHLINDVFLLLRHEIAQVHIKCDLKASTPDITVRGVPDQLRQVFLNLAMNSIQAMPQGGLIKVDTDLIMREGKPMASITFYDTGPGIPSDKISRIFEPFYSGKSGNLGLGLAICREIISRHGGTIEVTSTSMSGSTFRVEIPAGASA